MKDVLISERLKHSKRMKDVLISERLKHSKRMKDVLISERLKHSKRMKELESATIYTNYYSTGIFINHIQ